jgi:hypothetical protein
VFKYFSAKQLFEEISSLIPYKNLQSQKCGMAEILALSSFELN